jgi:hypothetical protein
VTPLPTRLALVLVARPKWGELKLEVLATLWQERFEIETSQLVQNNQLLRLQFFRGQ